MQNNNPEIIPELLTLPQAAALCGVCQKTLWTWATSGISPPPLHIGKNVVRYSRRAFEEWVSAGCPRTAAGSQGGDGDGNGEGRASNESFHI